MLLDEYCPLMANTEKRIRLRTKCFEVYDVQDVCKNRQFILMVPTIDQTQQVIPVILPPLFAPLGQSNMKPLILAPAIQIIEPITTTTTTSTTTTTTTKPPTTTSIPPLTTSIIPMKTNENLNDTNDNETLLQKNNYVDDIKIITEHVTATPITTATLNSNSTQTTRNINDFNDQTTTQKPSIFVLNMEDTPPSVLPSNHAIESNSNNVPKTEYATVEFIPTLENHNSPELEQPQQPPDVLIDEDSKSNSVHEEYHTKVITDYDNAPQSLLQPDEPPENP